MKSGCSLLVRGRQATQDHLLAMARQAEAWECDSLWAEVRPAVA